MTNTEIRAAVAAATSRAQLVEIAKLRDISTTGLTKAQIVERILRNLKRQEGYSLLAR